MYELLRNKTIEADELRKNLFDVNKMFIDREAKYEGKIKVLETEVHRLEISQQPNSRYETQFKELEKEVAALMEEKTQFLRVIENLEQQVTKLEKTNSTGTKARPERQITEPVSDQKPTRRPQSEILPPVE